MVPDVMVEALGVPSSFYEARDRGAVRRGGRSWYGVAMSERGVGSRLSQLATSYEAVDGGYRIKGSKTFCSGAGHADAYLVAARSVADQSVVSQFLVPADPDGLQVERPGTRWECAPRRTTYTSTWPSRRTRCSVASRALALVVAQLMPHWLIASYAAVYVGVAQAAIDAAVAPEQRRFAELPAVRARLGLRRRGGGGGPARRRRGGPPGRRGAGRRRPTAGCGGPSSWPARRRPRWRRPCWRRPARRPGAAIRWNGSTATPGAARVHPATSDVCADWLGMAPLGGDPDCDGSAPRCGPRDGRRGRRASGSRCLHGSPRTSCGGLLRRATPARPGRWPSGSSRTPA